VVQMTCSEKCCMVFVILTKAIHDCEVFVGAHLNLPKRYNSI
jgi:hypothetical protein